MNDDAPCGAGPASEDPAPVPDVARLDSTQHAVWMRIGQKSRPIGEVVAAYVAEFGGSTTDHLEAAAALLEIVTPRLVVPSPPPVPPEPPSPFMDLALRRYEPAAPMMDPLESIDLLWATLAHDDERDAWQRFVHDLHAAVGSHPIVWAVKYAPHGAVRRELYFLSHGHTLARIFDAVRTVTVRHAEWRALDELPARAIDFSIEPTFDGDGRLQPIERIDVRTMFDGGASHVVIAFDAARDGLELKNVYRTYDYPAEWATIRTRLAESRFATPDPPDVFNDRRSLGYGLVRGCRSVWLAEKRTCDGVYLTGLYLDAFVDFLDEFDLPRLVRAFTRTNERRLRHLRFDVGMDYRMTRDGFDVVGAGFFGTSLP